MKSISAGVIVLSLLIPTVSLASIDTNLQYGAQGVVVQELQDFLISKGFLSGQTTGNFFSLTRNAVIAYQKSVGLPATGFVGVMTRSKINNEIAQDNISSYMAEAAETKKITPVTTPETVNVAVKPVISSAVLFDDQAVFISNVPLDPHTLSIITPGAWLPNQGAVMTNCYKLPGSIFPYCPDWSSANSLPIMKAIIFAGMTSTNNYKYTVRLIDDVGPIISQLLISSPSNQRIYKVSINLAGGKSLTSGEMFVTASSTISLTF